jgi:hypothetical protein
MVTAMIQFGSTNPPSKSFTTVSIIAGRPATYGTRRATICC